MKILLVAVNSRYIHINAALRYLKIYSCSNDVGIAEFSIGDPIDKIEGCIYRTRPDVVGFSCYIWNIDIIRKLTELVSVTLPEALIIWGGPEVSYDSAGLLKRNSAVDIIIPGEGEKPFKALCEKISSGHSYHNTAGIVYRNEEGEIRQNPMPDPLEMDKLPIPLLDDDDPSRLVYYQSSRGCPYRCSYCLSSIDKGLRFKSVEKTIVELILLGRRGNGTVKLVDRTFNADIERAKTIFKAIINADGKEKIRATYHFEMSPGFIDDDMVDIIGSASEGLFQFEMGIQSTNAETLEAVNRRDWLTGNEIIIKRLINKGNVRIHLDLIAGLPLEDYKRFGESFDDVYRIKAHHLQLGFLKLLKGTRLYENAGNYGIIADDSPPYQVVMTDYLSHDDVLMLKDIESMTDIYYNSGHYKNTIDYIVNEDISAFSFYEELAIWWRNSGYFSASYSLKDRFSKLFHFHNTTFY